jgi:HEAT repeat protein
MNRTTVRIFLVALSGLVAVPALPARSSDRDSLEEQEQRLVRVLSAHEFAPSRNVFDRIGPDVNQLLVRIASSTEHRPSLRVRAVSALSIYPSDRSRRFLGGLLFERELVGTPSGTLLRREAMRSLAVGFGGEVVDELAPLKDDGDAQIREGCAHALGETKSPRAVPVLDAWLPHEPELFVRLAVDRAVSRLKRL